MDQDNHQDTSLGGGVETIETTSGAVGRLEILIPSIPLFLLTHPNNRADSQRSEEIANNQISASERYSVGSIPALELDQGELHNGVDLGRVPQEPQGPRWI